ncbi:MAG: ECF transporter S component [Clostridiales bacterium]|nr:ECF transporter S component [Clostridiales bacterium]
MRNEKLFRQVLTALFVALTLMLGLTPLGLIPLGPINLTILHIPVIIGTIFLGLRGGMLLGACFGIASTMAAFGVSLGAAQSGLALLVVTANPFLAICMCMIPRLMIPIVTHLAYTALRGKGEKRAVACAAVAGSLTNTVLYLGIMYLLFVTLHLDVQRWANAILTATALAGAFGEAPVAAILAVPVTAALFKQTKKR